MTDVGNVAVMEVTGDMNANAPDCMVYTPIRQAIASEFLRTHGDNYDFLVFLTTFDFAMPPGHDGFYLEVKNDTLGIGNTIFDRTGDFGSLGKLQGTIDLGNVMPLAANPYGPKLDPTILILNHEIMHRWGIRALFKDADGSINQSLLGESNMHWSYLLDTKGSFMYGNAWKDNHDGTYTSTAVETAYSPLDQYLMGMIRKDQVPPMLLIDNPGVDNTKLPELGATITGTAKTVTIDQIVAALGERVPDTAHSQKQFNVGFVLVTRPGMPIGNAPAAIEALRSSWAGRFAALTQGKASVANVPAALALNIDSPADGATITGPDVTVTGSIINTTGAETGVIVNGVAATVTGSRFVVNHLPIQSGANSLTVNATDSNGLLASSTRNITATAGDYVRLTANVQSGTAPLTVLLRVDGSFSINNPIISPSGPMLFSLTPGPDPATFTTTLSGEGTYTFIASVVGPDGTNYSDTLTISVLSKSQLETLLQAKWDGIKAKIAASDVEGAVSFLPSFSQDYYRKVFTSLGTALPTYSEDLPPIRLKSAFDSDARCLLLRQETVLGVQKTVGYQVYFIKEKGLWKLRYF